MLLEDRAQGAGTGAAADGFLGEGAQGVAGDAELHAVHGELLAVLFDQRVFRLGEDGHQFVLGQFAQRGNDGQAADEFRDEAEVEQVLRLDVFEDVHRRIIEVFLR